MIDQYTVYWVDLNPTRGAEINEIRLCVVISPSEMNDHLKTIIIAPVTSRGREGYPTCLKLNIADITGWIVLDQIRVIDKNRLCEQAGKLSEEEIIVVKNIIKEMLVD